MNTLLCFLAAAALSFDPTATETLRIAVDKRDAGAATAAIARGADVNAAVRGTPLLHAAAGSGQRALVEALIEAGADVDAPSAAGTALHAAAPLPDPECLKALLNAGADANAIDGSKRTALHIAAAKGAVGGAQALLSAGANPTAKDGEGKTPLDVSKQDKQAAIAALLAPSTVDLSKVVRIAAGADLQAAIQDATEAHVFLLAPGTYTGPIAVRGKMVRLKGDPSGKSVISGSTQQAAVYVSDKGKLTIENVHFRTGGQMEVGIFANDAEVTVRHCAFDQIPKYGCYAEKAVLRISDSRFTDNAGVSVGGLSGATIELRRCLFQSGKDAAVIGQESASVAISECQFERCVMAVSVRGGQTEIRSNAFTGATANPSPKPAFVVENASSIVFAGNLITNAKQGVVLRGQMTTPAAVARNVILNADVGVYAELTIDGKRPPLLFTRNTICNAVQGGLFLDKTSHARVTGSVLAATADGYALAMREGSGLHLDAVAAFAPKRPLVFDNCKPPVATLRRLCVIGGPVDLSAPGIATDETTLRMQQITTTTDSGARLQQAAENVIAAARTSSPDKPEALAQTAATLAAEVTYARQRAEQLASLTLNVKDQLGASGPIGFAVYEADSKAEEPPVAESIEPGPVSLPAGEYRVAVPELGDLTKRVKLTAAAAAAETIAAPGSLWLTFKGKRDQPPVRLLLPLKSPQAMREAVARIRLNRLASGVAAMPRPDVPRDQVESALSLARAHLPSLAKPLTKAANVKDEDHWQALTRKRWAQNAAWRILNVAGSAADFDLIVNHTGAESFYQKLCSAAIIANIEARLDTLPNGRLATIARGNDPAWARAAAMQLHEHGVTAADDVIVAALNDPAGDAASFAAFTMLDTPRRDVLEAMRGILDRSLTKTKADDPSAANRSGNVTSAVFLYLLAYGDSGDAKRIAAIPLDDWHAPFLSALAADPVPLGRYVGNLKFFDTLRDMVPYLRHLPAKGSAGGTSARPSDVTAAFEDIVWNNAGGDSDPKKSRPALNRHRALISFCLPNAVPARFFAEGSQLIPETTWVPEVLYPGKADEFMKAIAKGSQHDDYESQVDYLTPEEFTRAATAAKLAEALPHFEVYQAAHRICTRGFFYLRDNYHDGVERRPYTLRLKDGSGSLSGVLEVRPWQVEDRLRFAVRVVQTPHYSAGDFISAAMLKDGQFGQWAHHKFVINGGAALPGRLQLKRGDADVPLQACGKTTDGALLYEAAAGRSPAGLMLHVNLAFPDQPATLSFDLGTSDHARRLRALEQRLTHLEKAQRWVDAGRVLQAMGRFTEAGDRYQRAIAADPKRTDLADISIRMFSENGLHDRAAAILRDQVAARPKDAAAWRDLAGELYLARAYRDAAEAADQALALNATDKPAQLMRAIALFLKGDRASAVSSLEPITTELPQMTPLHHLAQAGDKRNDEKLRAYYGGLKEPERNVVGVLLGYGEASAIAPSLAEAAQVCRLWTFAGYKQLQSGNKEEARMAFSSALATGQERQLEYHMARLELDQLK